MSDNKSLQIDVENLSSVESVISEIEDSFYDIPFGNTAYQTKTFVVAAGITPERAYRAIGLQMLSVLNSLRNSIIGYKIGQIQLEQKKELLNTTTDKFEKQILELEILRDSTGENYHKKTINDIICELNVLYSEFKKLPKFTREQFEIAEQNYFTQSLERQARGVTGAVEGIINMNEDIRALEDYKEKIAQIELLDNETLNALRLSMTNQIKVDKDETSERRKAYIAHIN
jgi:hypothetical protein